MTGRRLRCLDGLRGVLATYVMLSHMAPLVWAPPGLAWLREAVSHGQACVDAFFILSGLVIVRSLAAHGDRAGRFFRARWWRIYPVYLAVLALAVPVQALPPVLDHLPWAAPEAWTMLDHAWPADAWARIAAHLTMTHGMFPQSVLPDVWVSFLGAAWSLSTEWQFYMLIVVIGGSRRGVWALSCAFLGLGLAGAAWHAGAPPGWQFSRAFLPAKAQFFALGIASAGLIAGQAGARGRYAWVLAATLALCFAEGRADKLLPPLLWTICLAAEMGAAPLRPLARLLTLQPLLWLGAVSYCLYLVNQPVQRLLASAFAPYVAGGVTFDVVWLPGAIALPLLAAWWLHRQIELPGIALGRDARRREGATAA